MKIPTLDEKIDILGRSILELNLPEEQKLSKEEYDNYILATTPAKYRDASFTKLPENLKGIVRKGEKGFLLTGPIGSGKTHSAWSIYKVLNHSDKECYMIDYDELMDNIRKSEYGKPSICNISNVENYSGLLILDDLGVREDSGWTISLLKRILSKRESWNRLTGFTTNLTLKEISDKFDDRIASRIAGHCEIVEFTGEDKRVN